MFQQTQGLHTQAPTPEGIHTAHGDQERNELHRTLIVYVLDGMC